jgi:pyruvate dehydrogenase E1 component alpha subunit
VVFVCENNLYATTLRVDTAVAGSITGRAAAFDIPASTVDGMDAEVVLAAASEAVARARAGHGPSLLEFTTYRFHGHHTFEIKAGLRYRDEAEVAAWRARDPMPLQESRVSPSLRSRVDAEIETIVDDAVAFAVASPRPDPADALAHHYATGLQVRAGVAS